jgi:arsenate reductase-like glutaredoxin family protein
MNVVNKDMEMGLRAMASFLMGCVEKSARKAADKGQKHGRKKALPILFSTDDLYGKLVIQNGKCMISNIPFPIMLYKTDYLRARKFYGVNRLLIASVDRIDSKKPYQLDNIQIVIRFINIGKTNCSQDELLEVVEMMKNPPTESIIYKKERKIKQNKNIKEMNTKNITQKLLIHLLNSGETELAEKYFMERMKVKTDEPNLEVKTNKPKTNEVKPNIKNQKRITNAAGKREFIEKNRKFVDECEKRKIELTSVSDINRNSKGHVDTSTFYASRMCTNIVNQGIQIYAEPRHKGVEYFIDKNDLAKVN